VAAAEKKEMAQALAYAYFAIHPNYKDPEHAIGFYGLFSGKENISIYKSKYLSDGFPIDKIKSEFAVTKTAKTQQLAYHPTAKKVYAVAKASVEKGIFKYPLSDYQFLDQSDPFMILVKDTSLINVAAAFELGINKQISSLSSIDLYAVKTSEKQKIVQRFKKLFGDKQTIIDNAILGNGQDYFSVTQEYMDAGILLPLSLKLPNNITSKPSVKRIQTTPEGVEVEPFMKVMSLILSNPTKTKEIINDVFEFDSKGVETHRLLNWVFPVIFNYDQLIDPATKKPVEDFKLKFNLFAQGHGAGWNGQFDVSTKKYKDTQWVGGVSSKTFEVYAKHYPEYDQVINDLIKVRVEAFNEVCEKFNVDKDMTDAKNKAADVMRKHKIVNLDTELKVLHDFFLYDKKAEPGKEQSFLHQFKLAVIRKINGSNEPYKGSIKDQQKLIDAHFIHAQLSMFLMRPKYELFFKQKMFFTIFGLITKMTHTIIDINDYKGMRNAIQKEIIHEGKAKLIEFTTAPHYLIS